MYIETIFTTRDNYPENVQNAWKDIWKIIIIFAKYTKTMKLSSMNCKLLEINFAKIYTQLIRKILENILLVNNAIDIH